MLNKNKKHESSNTDHAAVRVIAGGPGVYRTNTQKTIKTGKKRNIQYTFVMPC